MIGEMVDHGKVIARGSTSRAIPISAALARAFDGGIKIGDDFEWHREGNRLYIVFPDKPMIESRAKAPERGGTF